MQDNPEVHRYNICYFLCRIVSTTVVFRGSQTVRIQILKTKILFILIVVYLFLNTIPVYSYTYDHVGLKSNFLIDDGKVYFVQSDRSLTILNLETGEVIARKKDIECDWMLRQTERGIFMPTADRIYLLDKATLTPIWQIKGTFRDITEDCFLSTQETELECRDLVTGNIMWSFKMTGALDILPEKEKVLIFRSATYEGPEHIPVVVLLDIKTGQEMFNKTTPPGIHYLETYFDGDRIYVASGSYKLASRPYKEMRTPDITLYDKGRSSARFEKLLVWDLAGNEVDSIQAPENFKKKDRLRSYTEFSLVGKTFARGRIWNSPEDIPPGRPGWGKKERTYSQNDNTEINKTIFNIDNGAVVATKTEKLLFKKDGTEIERHIWVEFNSEMINWKGEIPYLKEPGEIVTVAAADGKLLLGTNFGHVECIDIMTAKSLWMYLFPTIRVTMSASSAGPPPHRSKAEALFYKDNSREELKSGIIIQTTGSAPSMPRIVLDPEPTNPFD